LGKESSDIDIAFKGEFQKLISFLELSGIRIGAIWRKYESLVIKINEKSFQFTSIRRDKNCNGRGCEIEKVSSFEEDANRRDFTVNSIYVSLDGKVNDPFLGIDDIKTKTLRFIGDPLMRIIEDNLRILRYYRFLSVIDSEHNPYSALMNENSHLVQNIPKPKMQCEMLKIIDGTKAAKILIWMESDGVLQKISNSFKIQNFNKLSQNAPLGDKLLALLDSDDVTRIFKLPNKMR
jgi:poly(A) polymerase